MGLLIYSRKVHFIGYTGKNDFMVSYIFEFFRIILIAVPVYLLYLLKRRPWKPVEGRRFSVAREAALGLFVVFMAALLVLTFQGAYWNPQRMLQIATRRLRTGEGINLVPFRTIRRYFGRDVDMFMVNIVGNIVMFVPWGFGLALLWKKNRKAWRIMLFSALLPVFIESVQLFILRSVDVDDLILNFLGGCLGGMLYAAIRKIWPKIGKLAE